MTDTIDELKQRARAGDLGALQELRERGFFGANNTAEGYPVSHTQRRLWIVDQMTSDSGTYHIPIALWLDGGLDAGALRKGLREVVRRHESLRTTFAEAEGGIRQFVRNQVDLPWEDIDLTADPEREEQARRIAAEHAARHFDVARGPLVRAALVRFAPQRHLFLFNIHHIVSDLISLEILVRELSACYEAFTAGRTPLLPTLPIQYKDFATWQNRLLDGEEGARHRAYWLRQLSHPLAPLDLPTDFPRPPLKTYHGRVCRAVLDSEFTGRLRQLGLCHGMTLFMVLAAAVKVLLHRYTGQEDITIAFPMAGRDHPDLAGQIGCFVNTVALRDRLAAEDAFTTVLGRVRQTLLDAYEHQAYPFDRLVEELELPRDMSRTPLFDVSVSLAHGGGEAPRFGAVKVSPYDDGFASAKVDLSFDFYESGDGLELAITYCTDLFAEERVLRMAEHFARLAGHAAANPQQPIGRMPLMSAEEEHRVLVEFNRTARPDAEDGTIVDLFERQAARSPDAVAVSLRDSELSYRELHAQANQLAHHLRGLGVGPEVLVGICTQRSPAMIVGLLGVLMAGGAYLPLDPAYPTERLAFMLEDAQVSVLLTQESLLASLPEHRARMVCLDTDWKSIAQASEEPPLSEVVPESLAYVIYTSGSTGKPKGVLVTHRGLCNLARSQIQTFAVQPSSRVLQFASLSFDASVSEVFMALCAGASLCLGSADDLLPGPALLRLLKQQAVTHMTLPPPALATLPAEGLSALQAVIVAGEACPSELVARWSAGRRFFNAYGPTEATVCATIAECTDSRRRPSIGRPIANTEVYILDEHLRPAPVGVPGELHIGGIGLARGYLNRPKLTDERFIANPYVPGTRLYKTGDLARYLPDGNIEFLGRLDRQVKIRGFRIEPEEIEHALGNHPEIGEAVVLATENDRGAKTLAAFVTRRKPVELWPSIAEFFVYDDVVYRSMATHESRNHRYRAAFRKVLKGKKVVEIGPGPDAVLSRLSLEAGAEKVYAIEILEDTCRKAQQTVKALGLEDKIVLIHGDATQVELPEKVDYCISEIVGSIGGAEGAARIINSARRFLHDPRCMIPQRSLTKLAAVTLPESAIDFRFPEIAAHYVDKIFAQVGYPFDLRICLKNLPRENIVSTADVLEDLDYTVETPSETTHDITLTFMKDAVFHGLLVWLTLYTDQEQVVDILEQQQSWLPVYFPLFQAGVEVAKGDVLEGSVSRCLSENGLNPDYFIQGRLLARRNADVVSFHYRAYHFERLYKNSPFYARLFADDGIPVRPRLSGNALRTYLAGHLPNYMIPARIVELSRLPLAPNAKVDRDALLRADTFQESERGYVAPGTPTEEVLARIWGEVLRRDRVGIHDNFFELGGDSLVATRTVSRLREVFRADVSIADLFRAGTVGALAEVLRGALPDGLADKVAAAVLRLRGMSSAEKEELLKRKRA